LRFIVFFLFGILTFLQLLTSIPIHLGDAERERDHGITSGFAAAILSEIGFVLHNCIVSRISYFVGFENIWESNVNNRLFADDSLMSR